MFDKAIDFITRFKRNSSGNKKILNTRRNYNGEFDGFLDSWLTYTQTKISASAITDILSGAEDGYAQEQATLFQTIMEKEPVIAAHIQTRILAVLACDWNIVPASSLSGSGETLRKAEELKKLLKSAGIYKLMKHLLDAIPTGYAGSAIIWEEGGGGISEFKHVNPANWIFDRSGNPALIMADGREKAMAEYHPNQFIFHTHQMKPGIPSRGGLLRTLAWLYFFKHYALKDRARYLERFGIPFMAAKVTRDDFENENIKNQLLSSLRKMGSDGIGLITQDSDIHMITPSQNGGDDFHKWFSYIDEVYALSILGQLASSSQASGLSKGQMQENVRLDILEADCRSLMETVNKDIIIPLEQFKYGYSGDCEFVLDFSMQDDIKQKAEIVKILSGAGYSVDPAYIRKTFGIPLVETSVQSIKA